MEERELLVRAQKGDADAFGQLVRLHQAGLRAFAALYVSSGDDILDIVQDAFVDAFRHMDRFDPTKTFKPWLRAICRNRIRNFYRARAKMQMTPLSLVDEAVAERVAEADAEQTPEAQDQIDTLRLCINRLGEAQRQLVTLRYGEAVRVNDIAARLKKSAATISMRLMRIRNALRKCMQSSLQTVLP